MVSKKGLRDAWAVSNTADARGAPRAPPLRGPGARGDRGVGLHPVVAVGHGPSTVGQSATVSWTGTIPPGSHGTSDCATVSGDPTVDHHGIELTVPAGIYSSVTASFSFSITWTPGTPTEDTADEVLTLLDPSGAEVGSSDGGSTTETVAAQNLAAGTYNVLACRFVNGAADRLHRLADDHDDARTYEPSPRRLRRASPSPRPCPPTPSVTSPSR